MDKILDSLSKDPLPFIVSIVGPILLALGNWTQARLARDRGEGKQDEAAAATQMTFITLATTQISELKQALADQRTSFDGKIANLKSQLEEQATADAQELAERETRYARELAEREERLHAVEAEKTALQAQVNNLQTIVLEQGAQIVKLSKRLDDSQDLKPVT